MEIEANAKEVEDVKDEVEKVADDVTDNMGMIA